MHCLLCHQKIPRIRHWRTKSEFCCDEHAATHRRQTMERLVGRIEPENIEAARQSFDARVEARLSPPPLPSESMEVETLESMDLAGLTEQSDTRETRDQSEQTVFGYGNPRESDGFEQDAGDEIEEEQPRYHAEAVQRDEPFPMELRALPPASREVEDECEAEEQRYESAQPVETEVSAASESLKSEPVELAAVESSSISDDLQATAESVQGESADALNESFAETIASDSPAAESADLSSASLEALELSSGQLGMVDELNAEPATTEVSPAAEVSPPSASPVPPPSKTPGLKPVKAWDPSRRPKRGRLVVRASGPESLNQLANGINLRSGLVGPDGKKPTLVCFLPVQGGNGASTVSLHVAEAISHHLNERVLLADFDFHSGTLAFRLGLRPVHTLGDVFEWRQEKDHTWENAVCRWKKLDVLVAPPSNASIHPQNLDRLPEIFISAMRRYPYVIVDHPDAIYSSSRHIMTLSDLVYLVCTPEITSLHLARRKVQQIRAMGVPGERLRLIVNRAGSWGSLGVQDIGKIVGVPVSWALDNDYAALRDAVWNGGLVQEGSALAGQLRELGWSVMGVDAPVAAESAAPAEVSSQGG